MAASLTLNLSIDFGGSGSKVIYQFGGSQLQYMMLPPGLEEVNLEDFKRYKDLQVWRGDPLPEDDAWLEWKGSIYVVGDFALEFAAQDRIKERKYENALYKTLAIIGIILEKHQVGAKKRKSSSPKIILHLAILLPWNEYNDNERFRKQLELMLKSFKFRGVAWDIALKTFLCRPEGAGLLAIRIKQQGKSWFQESTVLLLMFGHRNTTCLYFEKGIRKVGDSPLLGFSNFLDDVCSRVSGLEREQLARAIFSGLCSSRHKIYRENRTKHPEWENLEAIKSLATARDEQLRASEAKDIARAIIDATPDYWFRVCKWLDSKIPFLPDEVIVGGGAAVFLEPELEEYFNCEASKAYNAPNRREGERPQQYQGRNFSAHSDLVWLSDVQTQIEGIFQFGYNSRCNQLLSFRLLDAFGMMDQLKETVKEVVQNAQQQEGT
ncbi:hypothetical protein F7734_13005 [Scytonema sp. UIC 10036]|uniref:ParM/StbA family protein n=1 Tax=Scytonema sp. UIC 10036 TaxID=2304196 RepID=UPI0012DA5CD1|nr:ParM/StbA family protein [Scytonema sp. UIC 10036]MUG93297.1 hypothetical protein [Scytonema sp. UIC 10036]